jgi:GAF domain-containing protein
MPIQPAALAASIGALPPLDVEHGFAPALQRVVDAAKLLFHADAAGLMLAGADGALRWASANDRAAQVIEAGQEHLAQGPCWTAFSQRAPAALRDATLDLVYLELTAVLLAEGVMAGLSVPVEVEGGPIGTLDVYMRTPRDWDASEVAALQAFAGLVGSLLASAAAAHVQGRLAGQLQTALEHRSVIERAKGMLMARDGLDGSAAFERLRGSARSSRRTVPEIAREVLDQGQDGHRPPS